DGCFTFVTPSIERCVGFSVDEVMGVDIYDILTSQSRSKLYEEMQYRHTLSYFEPVVMDLEHTCKDGTTKWCEISADFTFDDQGAFLGMAGVSRDVTERKVAEERMRESETRYSGLFDRSLDCVYIHDFDGMFIDANPAALNLLGYGKKELRNLDFSSLIGSEQLKTAFSVMEEIRRTGYQSRVTEYTLRRKDGAFVEVETMASLIYSGGKPNAIQGIARDITDRKRSEEALRTMLDKISDYESIVNRSPAVVFLWRVAEGWPVEFVSENVRHYGYTPDDFTSGGASWPGITHPEDVPRLERELRANAERGVDEFSREYRLFAKSGEVRWINDLTKAIHDANGSITHYQGIILDVTERKIAEQKEKQYVKKLNFLSKCALEYASLSPDDNMYRFICDKLHSICGDAVVIINSFDEDTGLLRVREFIGLDGRIDTLIRHLGRHPVGMTFTLNEEQKAPIRTGALVTLTGGVSELTFGLVPKVISKTIEKIFDVGTIYGIGFVTQGKIYGTAIIVTYKNSGSIDTELVETFCNQASIVLQKWLTENALRENERKYHNLTESINDIMYYVDLDGIIRYMGPQIGRYGFSPEMVIGRKLMEFVHPDDLDLVKNDFEHSIFTGEKLPTQFRMTGKDGVLFWVEDNGMIQRDDNGKTVGLTGVLRDITKRKETEDALVHSENRFREQARMLEQKNIALREIVGQIEIEKKTIKDEIVTNVHKLVFPILDKIRLMGEHGEYVDVLRHVLENLTSSFGRNITQLDLKLTPREIDICTMIKSGLTNKEIARLLNISSQTVENHRKHIRRKLDITNKHVNLAAYLRHIS
ncbi:MAG: PAS domain S-box protein, partial [Candidatus Latescibacteria bacterium]|nr:PAS domain S-box protein [Candidatus Latescibacterota bacterium]